MVATCILGVRFGHASCARPAEPEEEGAAVGALRLADGCSHLGQRCAGTRVEPEGRHDAHSAAAAEGADWWTKIACGQHLREHFLVDIRNTNTRRRVNTPLFLDVRLYTPLA